MAPEIILLVIMWIAITLYALLGGADFGAGIWEFNTALQATDKERKLIYKAVGPVWEANHVWLIFLIVMTQTLMPAAFGILCRALWLPLLLALAGIVFRGAAFAFRSYAVGARTQQSLWGAVFALASTAAPFFLGAAVGAVASGHIQVADGRFTGNYITGWISPTSMFTAFFTVGICAYLAAVYLAREAQQQGEAELVEKWRQRAIATGSWMGVLALTGLAVLAHDAPLLWSAFQQHALPFVFVSVVTGFFSLWALWTYRFTLASAGVALTVASVIWGWGVGQFPWIIPPSITIETAKGPDTVLWTAVGCIAVGTLVLLPSLVFLFVLFKSHSAEVAEMQKEKSDDNF